MTKSYLDCRIHLLQKEHCCCFLPVVNWGVSGVTAFLCQLCCQHAPGVPREPQDKQHSAPQAVHTHTHRAGTKQVPWSAKRRGQSAWLTSALLSSWQQTLAPPVQGFGGGVPHREKKCSKNMVEMVDILKNGLLNFKV